MSNDLKISLNLTCVRRIKSIYTIRYDKKV